MKVKFLGVVEKRTKGCVPCGRARHESAFVSRKLYFLPSGVEKTFYVGRTEDVSDADAEFLLGLEYKTPGGETKKVFEHG